MRRRFFASLFMCMIMLLVGCSRGAADAADVQVAVAIAPNPPRVGEAQVTVMLTDQEQQAIPNATVEVECTMTHAGMLPVEASAKELEPGTYHSTVELTMDGDWMIIVHATLPDGRTLERNFAMGTVQH